MDYVETDTGSDNELLGLHWKDNKYWELVKGKNNVTGNDNQSRGCKITDIKATAEGVTIPNLLKDAGLFEVGPHTEDYKNQWFWARTDLTFYPIHGCLWYDMGKAGFFATSLIDNRTYNDAGIGFILYLFK